MDANVAEAAAVEAVHVETADAKTAVKTAMRRGGFGPGIETAGGQSTGRPGDQPPRQPSPLSYFFAAKVASVAAIAGGKALDIPFLSGRVPAPWNSLGFVIIAAGVILLVGADAQFQRAGTSVKPFSRASKLVTGGLFAYSRNPMYLGMLTVLLGVAVAWGSMITLLVAAVFAWAVRRTFILPEEWRLESQFGHEYRRYRERVTQWI